MDVVDATQENIVVNTEGKPHIVVIHNGDTAELLVEGTEEQLHQMLDALQRGLSDEDDKA